MELSNVLPRQTGLLLGVGERAKKCLSNHGTESTQDGVTLVTSEDRSQPRNVAELVAVQLTL